MADTHETIADIIAEMRGIRVREFQDYADRLEAAHKRELSKNVSKNGADFGKRGGEMSVKWEYNIPIGCGNVRDGAEIYGIVEDFAKRHNVVWDNDRFGRSMFVYEAEAYNVPSAKTSKFVRYACQWFAEAIAEHGKDEGERVAMAKVTVISDGSGLFRSTFKLSVSWREWSYTLQQYLFPRHGDEAFYDWDEDDAKKKGGAK